MFSLLLYVMFRRAQNIVDLNEHTFEQNREVETLIYLPLRSLCSYLFKWNRMWLASCGCGKTSMLQDCNRILSVLRGFAWSPNDSVPFAGYCDF